MKHSEITDKWLQDAFRRCNEYALISCEEMDLPDEVLDGVGDMTLRLMQVAEAAADASKLTRFHPQAPEFFFMSIAISAIAIVAQRRGLPLHDVLAQVIDAAGDAMKMPEDIVELLRSMSDEKPSTSDPSVN